MKEKKKAGQYEIPDANKAKQLAACLMTWYHANHRDLIWRQTRDPYRIWISEIMAQQTRITAVLPYYKRFIARFPTLESLAQASDDEVLKAWEGLGYYSRAHNLLKTAKIIWDENQGRFPRGAAALRKLPGIGDYTAGAISSICFDEPEPAVDGNVQRVFARLYANHRDIADPKSKKLLTEFVRTVMPEKEPGIFNQSLMELGALVCVPQNPLCGQCPAAAICRAKEEGLQRELPVKTPKKRIRQEDKTILLIADEQGRLLLRQRDERLLNGLWEFYMRDGAADQEQVEELLQKLPCRPMEILPVGRAQHVFTHMQWNMQGFYCRVGQLQPPEGYVLVPEEELPKLAMPTALQFFRHLLEFDSPQMMLNV